MTHSRIGAGALAIPQLLACHVPHDTPGQNLTSAGTCADTTPVSAKTTIGDQGAAGGPQVDRSKPVPPKSEIPKAWQKRQAAISFQFSWIEQQCHPRNWVPNPRYAEREWLAIPSLLFDRSYTVNKSLAVDQSRMRYSFELDRKEEPDGVEVISPRGENRGLGVRRHYSYLGVFDGQRGEVRLSSLTGSPRNKPAD